MKTMMQGVKQEIAKSGESLACRYLKEHGYKILLQNFTSKMGEIDIIAKKDGTIHFFEVKTRHGMAFGSPFDSITKTKQNRIKRTAQLFLMKMKGRQMPCLFGAIGINCSTHPPAIECIVDAFE